MSAAEYTLIGVALGGALSFGGQWLLDRSGYDRAREVELQVAMREFLAAVDAVMFEASGEMQAPELNRLDRKLVAVTKLLGMDFVGEIAARILQRLIYGQRPQQLVDRMGAATAHLRLIAPPEIDAILLELDGLGKRYKQGDHAWQAEWTAFRTRMRAAFREHVQSGANRRRLQLRRR
jgi:hypothetical protein